MTFEITLRQEDEGKHTLFGWIHHVDDKTGETKETLALPTADMSNMSVKKRAERREKFVRQAMTELFQKIMDESMQDEFSKT